MMKKIMNLLATLVLVLTSVLGATTAVVKAEDTALAQTTKSVTVHKLLATDGNMQAIQTALKDGYTGEEIKDLATKASNAKEIAGVMFVWTKAKEVEVDGTKVKKDEVVNASGVGLGVYVENNKLSSLPEGALAGLTEASGKVFDTSKLPAGDYKIYEIHELSTYKDTDGKTLTGSLAVPVEISLPLNDVVDAHVYPKNVQDKPQIDKNFAKDNGLKTDADLKAIEGGAAYANYQAAKAAATATIGQTVPYEVKTQIPQNAKYAKLVWTDTMTNGLTMGDRVNLEATGGDASVTFTSGSDYTTTIDSRGFTLAFTAEGLAKLQTKAAAGAVEFTLTYSATVNGTAVVDVADKNDIRLDYGNNPGIENEEQPVTPNEGKITVSKTWATGSDTSKAKVVYTLKDGNGTAVASVYLDSNITTGTYDLGNGVKFAVTGAFAGTFTGLNDATTYYISERVSGYSNTIAVTGNAAAITNTPDTDNPTPLDPTEPSVVTHGKKFVKVDQTTSVRLAGAEFVVKFKDGNYLVANSQNAAVKKAYEEADAAYKAAVAKVTVSSTGTVDYGTTSATEIQKLKEERDAAYKASQMAYTTTTDVNEATKFVSNDLGQFEITGLAAGDYEVIETKAPAGYALPSNTTVASFTAKQGSYSESGTGETAIDYVKDSNSKDALRVNNKKVTIPQTGGIGTIIFAVAGALLMAFAVIAYIKNNKEEEELA